MKFIIILTLKLLMQMPTFMKQRCRQKKQKPSLKKQIPPLQKQILMDLEAETDFHQKLAPFRKQTGLGDKKNTLFTVKKPAGLLNNSSGLEATVPGYGSNCSRTGKTRVVNQTTLPAWKQRVQCHVNSYYLAGGIINFSIPGMITVEYIDYPGYRK